MEPYETFDFLTAIKYLLEGKRVCGKDWIDSYLTINLHRLFTWRI